MGMNVQEVFRSNQGMQNPVKDDNSLNIMFNALIISD